jgi:sec-independent protein translocase protein TatA
MEGDSMMGLSMGHLVVVLLVVVVLFGAKKLPEIGSGMGRAIRNFKKATSEPDELDITPKSIQQKKEAGSDEKKPE